ncbi:LexA family protein [Adhaeribacter pallidiroseus]|uniref:Protein MucA n=1 Tax=Adhaeribacter pallidiroseus TaxID=2072847 RepID=A0A369QM46_9BACT|nr:translesion error-prone DNA polymerase V autoproteolytic subunit [Adhaeribacter pallidiroseus]RDC64296.1 Protein MucA [Adhaeribacter pallidiroseus]
MQILATYSPTSLTNSVAVQLYEHQVPAGFPSPAADFTERTLDLNEFIVKRPSATFFVEVSGDSMQNAGIYNKDIIVVDKSLRAVHGNIVLALVQGEFTVKRLHYVGERLFLRPENEKYQLLEITSEMDFVVWGVVIHVLHKLYGHDRAD